MRHHGTVQTDWFGTKLTPLAGGYSGETFLVGEHGAQQVLRIYARDPDRCVVDAALLRLVEGVLPVPHVIESRPPVGASPGVLVTERVRGLRLDVLLATASPASRVRLASSVGTLLAQLSGIPQLRFGFYTGADLTICADAGLNGLAGWGQHFRDTGRLAAWRDSDYDALVDLLQAADETLGGELPSGERLEGPALTRVVLAHGDFNPKNLLVDAETEEITALVDWEFAHAGSPYTDLGNLTRFERHADFVSTVVDTFVTKAPALVEDPLTMARAADLWALVELAGRTGSNAVQELATTLLLAQARSGDLHAWPWASRRVDPGGADAVF